MQVAELPRWIVKDDAEVRDFFSVAFTLVLVSFIVNGLNPGVSVVRIV